MSIKILLNSGKLLLSASLILYIIVNSISLYQDRKSLIEQDSGSDNSSKSSFEDIVNLISVASWSITALSFSGGFLIEFFKKMDNFLIKNRVKFISDFYVHKKFNEINQLKKILKKINNFTKEKLTNSTELNKIYFPSRAKKIYNCLANTAPKFGIFIAIPFAIGTSFFSYIALKLTTQTESLSIFGATIAFSTIMIDYINSNARKTLREAGRKLESLPKFCSDRKKCRSKKTSFIPLTVLIIYTFLTYFTLYQSLNALVSRAEENETEFPEGMTAFFILLTVISGFITSFSFNGSFLFEFAERLGRNFSSIYAKIRDRCFSSEENETSIIEEENTEGMSLI